MKCALVSCSRLFHDRMRSCAVDLVEGETTDAKAAQWRCFGEE
jgi:hypothetical protein